jgi:hypothetical protein
MRLIGLAVVLAVSLALAPVVAEGQQQAEKVYRIGWILSSSSIGTAGPLALRPFQKSLPRSHMSLPRAR